MRKLLLFISIACISCTSAPPATAIYINLVDNHQSIIINGVDSVILNDINRDSVKNWQSLFAIYRLPADDDSKDYQPSQPGKYQLKAGGLKFTPDTPFITQQKYFVRYYNYADNTSIWDYIRHKTTKGQLHYIDLIFKP